MERFRIRRRRSSSSSRDSSPTKSTVDNHRSSSDERPLSVPADRSLKGRVHGRKENSSQKPGSSSSSRSNMEEDLLTLHLGQHTSGLLTGTVMKKLLADEMSREIESRRKPSVVARLMGLDGFPPTAQEADKRDKRIAALQRYGDAYQCQSHRSSSKVQHQFKDVYEVAEYSKEFHDGGRSQNKFAGRNSQTEKAFVRGKLTDGKRPSSYERYRNTKEFYDALEVIESDKDLMRKFLDTPESVFAQHLHHLRDAPGLHSGHENSMKSSALKHNINAIGSQSGWEASRKIDVSFSHKHQDGLHSHSCQKHGSDSKKMSYCPAESKDSPAAVPTRIVVLKPNTAKLQNSEKFASPHDSLSYLEASKERHARAGDAESWYKKHLPDGSGTSGLDCRESRQLAREVTRQMKQKLGDGSFILSLNGYKGYSADESNDLSGNDSPYESEAINVASKLPLCWRGHDEASGSRYAESSVNREARKRLSERWTMTRRSQGSGLDGKGSTLGEMLAVPELDARLSGIEASVARESSCRVGRRDGIVGSIAPLGISSRDGWKYEPLRKLSRSRSLPAYSDYLGSPKINWRREALVAERFLVPKEHLSRPRNKSTRRSGSIRTSNRRSGAVYQHDMMIRDVVEVQSSMNQKEDSFEDNSSPEVKAVISETPAVIPCSSSIIDEVVCLGTGNSTQSSASLDEQIAGPEFPGVMAVQDESCSASSHKLVHKEPSESSQIEDCTYSHCPASGSELAIPIEEEHQPSPNSILDGSLAEDLSSGSECFERVNSGLHGLRMQLQLLKQESDAYVEGPSEIPSEDDAGEISNDLSEERGFLDDEEGWASSYFLDVLADSGFDRSDLEMLKATWDSVGCLVAHWVFENLEKNYSGIATCSRIERKLLFDRINSGITEILERISDPHPWVNHGNRIASPQWDKDMIKAELSRLLKQQEDFEIVNSLVDEQVLESDLKWMNLGDHIDGVAMEIEQLMIGELIADFVTM